MIRKLFLTGLAMLLATVASFASGDKTSKKAVIALDSTVANIGTFPKSSSTVLAVFTFKNTGDEKLVFYDSAPDCGCVSVKMPDKPIKPGKKGQIIITYKGLNKKPGKVNHKVYFACSGSPSHFELRIRGVMTEK